MFKPKTADSQFLNNTTLPRLNETCNGAPKVTSTPLCLDSTTPKRGKLLLTPVVARRGTPRRYSLSDISPKSSLTTSNSIVTIKTTHGPGLLLSSMSPKDSISMYEETKSSGLARRIVLYNEEAKQARNQTHQEQYNSPGLFPLVHLFKEKPPLLQQSPKRVKIKLASSEYTRNFSPQQRSTVLEGLTRARLERQQSLPPFSQNDTGNSTKSVLDALKEISRKRIHSNEGYEHEEELGKRVRTDLSNGCAYMANKRTRSDSSPLNSSSGSPSPKQTQKKICVYDEFTASKSSSDFSYLEKPEPARLLKKKTISTSTESISEPKQVKLVTSSTQTLTATTSETEKTKVHSDEPPKEVKEKPVILKVFDDAPLERMRRNRLATLLGNLAGKDMSMFRPKKKEESLKSILTTQKEPTAEKPEKHVHFSAPSPQPSLTQVSSSIVNPIMSDLVTVKSPTVTDPSKKVTEIFSVKPNLTQPDTSIAKSPAASVSLASNLPITSTAESSIAKKDSAPPFSFGGSPKTTSFGGSPKATEAPKASLGFSFGSNIEKSTTTTMPSFGAPQNTTVAPISSSSGFGAVQSVTSKTAPTVSFGAIAEQKTTSTSVTTSTAPTFSFAKPATTTVGTIQQHPQTKPPQAFGTPATTASIFGSVSTTAAPTFGLTVSSTSTPLFGGSVSSTAAPAFGMHSATTTTPLGFGGTTHTTTAAASFGSGSTASPAFGGGGASLTTTVPSFGRSTAPPAFGQVGTTLTTSAITFGSGSTASPAFAQAGTASTNAAITFGSISTASPAFAPAGTASTTSAITFGGASTTPPTFGQAAVPLTTAAPTFGSSTAPTAFGSSASSTAAPIFGAAASSNTSSLTFGAAAPTFGASAPAFGASTPTFGFGSNATTTTALSAPTTTAPPAFGSTFGANATTTTASAFGGGGNPTSAPPPAFGGGGNSTSAPPPAFGSSNMFGNAPQVTQAPSFGGFNAQPQFGRTATATTASFGGFGGAPAPAVTTAAPSFSFGSSSSQAPPNPFGASATTSSGSFGTPPANFGAFGGSSSTFGGQSSFSQTEQQKSTFSFGGAADNKAATPAFGSTSSAFVKTSAPQSGFGSSSVAPGGFGSTSSTPNFKTQQANGGFKFNQSTPSSSSFAFGGTTGNAVETPKPSFNFSGASTNPPSFGTPNTSFGAAAPPQPAFGAVGTPTFNIGSGSAPSGRRVQRAKRRT